MPLAKGTNMGVFTVEKIGNDDDYDESGCFYAPNPLGKFNWGEIFARKAVGGRTHPAWD